MKAAHDSSRQQKLDKAIQIGMAGIEPRARVTTVFRVPANTVENGKFAVAIGVLTTYTVVNIVSYKKNNNTSNGHNIWSFFTSRNGRIMIQGLSEALRLAVSK